MGKRGPAKTPTALLRLAGSRLVAERENEPQPELGWPDPPSGLTEAAQVVWEGLLPKLERLGVLSTIDGSALGRYCEMYVRWWKANEFIAENGEVYESLSGKSGSKYRAQHPEVSIAATLHTSMLRIEQEFGLTPASRAGLKVEREKPQKGDDRKRFFGDSA